MSLYIYVFMCVHVCVLTMFTNKTHFRWYVPYIGHYVTGTFKEIIYFGSQGTNFILVGSTFSEKQLSFVLTVLLSSIVNASLISVWFYDSSSKKKKPPECLFYIHLKM